MAFVGILSQIKLLFRPLVIPLVWYIWITSWLVSAYDFYSRVVKDRKRTSESSSERLCDSSQQVVRFHSDNDMTINSDKTMK